MSSALRGCEVVEVAGDIWLKWNIGGVHFLFYFFYLSAARCLWQEVGDWRRMTSLRSDSRHQFQDFGLAWLKVIKDSTWPWLGTHETQLDLTGRTWRSKSWTFAFKTLRIQHRPIFYIYFLVCVWRAQTWQLTRVLWNPWSNYHGGSYNEE